MDLDRYARTHASIRRNWLRRSTIGKALQFFVADVPDHPDYPMLCILDGKALSPSLIMPLSLANPVVTPLPSDEYYYEEGCLSFPGINADVARPERILVTYQDLDGIEHTLECDRLLARCIQHEVDHLNGILFIDRMEKKTYAEIKQEVQVLKKAHQSDSSQTEKNRFTLTIRKNRSRAKLSDVIKKAGRPTNSARSAPA